MSSVREYTTQVAGTRYRQDEIARCHDGHDVTLIRNPENEHDENAIEVWAGELHIGFNPRDMKEVWAAWMDEGAEFEASIGEFLPPSGGTRFIGVVLDVVVSDAS
ncbi:MAG: HIRAN domain-containing protein [Litoreibacter sp.]|nr:HIRAN domain-containing protein [Litoreibacter sp.]